MQQWVQQNITVGPYKGRASNNEALNEDVAYMGFYQGLKFKTIFALRTKALR